MSVAILLWSLALARRPGLRLTVAALGSIAGALPVLGLLSGHLPINVFLAFVLSQTLWGLAVAALLSRNRI